MLLRKFCVLAKFNGRVVSVEQKRCCLFHNQVKHNLHVQGSHPYVFSCYIIRLTIVPSKSVKLCLTLPIKAKCFRVRLMSIHPYKQVETRFA